MDNLRRFILVFTCIIFVTLSVCGFLLAKSFSKSAKTENVDLSVNTNVYDPNKPQDSILNNFNENILVAIGDSDGTPSELTMLVNVNSITNEISLMYLPANLKYATLSDRSVGTIGMICNKKGIANAADILASQYEITVDNYLYMPSDVFAEFIDLFVVNENSSAAPTPAPTTSSPDGIITVLLDASNAVEFTIPVDLKYSTGKYDIDLPKDTKFLTGKEALQLIQFYRTENNEYSTEMLEYYDGTDIKRIYNSGTFINAFINQKLLKTGNSTFADEFAAKINPLLAKCQTNLNETNLKQIGNLLTRINPDSIKSFIINGTDLFMDKYYLVYNDTVSDISNKSLLDGATIFKDKFKTN